MILHATLSKSIAWPSRGVDERDWRRCSGPVQHRKDQVVYVDHAVAVQVGWATFRLRRAHAPIAEHERQVGAIDQTIAIEVARHIAAVGNGVAVVIDA